MSERDHVVVFAPDHQGWVGNPMQPITQRPVVEIRRLEAKPVREAKHFVAPELIAEEREHDASDEGRLRALAAEAAAPDEALKRTWMTRLLDPKRETTLAEFRAVAGGLFPRNQAQLRSEFTADTIAALPAIEQARDQEFYEPLIRGVLEPICSRDYLSEMDRAVETAKSLHPEIQRILKDLRFDVARCLSVAATLDAAHRAPQ